MIRFGQGAGCRGAEPISGKDRRGWFEEHFGIDDYGVPPYGPAPLTIGVGSNSVGVGTALALE
jgi:hypothetical protein